MRCYSIFFFILQDKACWLKEKGFCLIFRYLMFICCKRMCICCTLMCICCILCVFVVLLCVFVVPYVYLLYPYVYLLYPYVYLLYLMCICCTLMCICCTLCVFVVLRMCICFILCVFVVLRMCVCCTLCVFVVLCVYCCSYFRCRTAGWSQYPDGPATGHLDTGFSWFPRAYKRMLRWFLSFQDATTCLSCSPPDLNFLVTFFLSIFVYM